MATKKSSVNVETGSAARQTTADKPGLFRQFKEFLREYKVLSLAIAFVIGQSSTTLVQSMVTGIIMPLITPILPSGGWEKAIWVIGPFKIAWGPFVAAFINFLIIAFFVFLVAKFVLREEKVGKK